MQTPEKNGKLWPVVSLDPNLNKWKLRQLIQNSFCDNK